MIPDPVGSRLMVLGYSNDCDDICRVCGARTKLTDEHVPAEAAGNNRNRYWTHSLAPPGSSDSRSVRRQYQHGFKLRTVCERCNNVVLSQVQPAYVEFVRRLIERVPIHGASGLAWFPTPERHRDFMRTVIGMMLAIEPSWFGETHADLRSFVLGHQERVDTPFAVRAFRVPNSMYAGTVQPLHARVGTYAPDFALTLAGEISVYPFGLVYSFGQCGAAYELDELPEIGHWARYEHINPYIGLPTMPTAIDSINRLGGPRVGPEWGTMPVRPGGSGRARSAGVQMIGS